MLRRSLVVGLMVAVAWSRAGAAPVPKDAKLRPDPLAPAYLAAGVADIKVAGPRGVYNEVWVRWTDTEGLDPMDTLLALNGLGVESCDALKDRLTLYRPGAVVLFTVRTLDGRVFNRYVTLAAWEIRTNPKRWKAR